jgi:hypothetical protein
MEEAMTTPTRTDSDMHRRPARRLLAAAVSLTAVALQLIAVPAAGAATKSAPSPSPGPGNSSGVTKSGRATFGIGPARHGKADRFRAYFLFGVTPGAQLTDQVVVTNYARTPLALSVYAADAFNADNGDFSLRGEGIRPRDAGAWIAVGKTHSGAVSVAPRSSVALPIRLSVPTNATPGDHAAGVIASLSTISKDKNGANVRLLQRVGVRVFIRVAGDLHPQLSVERLSAHYVDNWNPIGRGSAVVTYRVHNTGNVQLGARQQVSVHGLLGPTARVAPRAVPLLLPGGHIDYRVVVRRVVPAIWTTASVKLTPTVLPGTPETGLHSFSASTHFWAVPWIVLAILVLALAGGGWWWWRRRRESRGPAPSTPVPADRPDKQDTHLAAQHRQVNGPANNPHSNVLSRVRHQRHEVAHGRRRTGT